MLYIEKYEPYVRTNFAANTVGLATAYPVDFSAAATVALPAATTIGGSSVVALSFVTSTSANALGAGANGTTNPVFNVDASTASVATGINVKGAAAASGVAVSVISSGTNENLTIDAKGSGTITLNGTGTGKVVLARSVDVVSAGVIAGLGTGTNGITLKNLKNSAASALSGTQLDITIDIGGTPYYFTVYPTKA